MENITAFFESFPAWLNAILALMVAASAITALTPSKKDDEILQKIINVLNVLALNIGKNKNADDQ